MAPQDGLREATESARGEADLEEGLPLGRDGRDVAMRVGEAVEDEEEDVVVEPVRHEEGRVCRRRTRQALHERL